MSRPTSNTLESNDSDAVSTVSRQAEEVNPIELKIQALSEMTNKPLAVVFHGDNFDPDKDFHVVTFDEPYLARRKCLIIFTIVTVIFILLLGALIYTITRKA